MPDIIKNTTIWDQVCKTDPRHTKKVNQRGGFTAIDAHYQVQRATEVFGPVGIGWGYHLFNIVPYVLTLLILVLTCRPGVVVPGSPGELSSTR